MQTRILVLCLLLTTICISQNNRTTVYLIRHAEKLDKSKDPELSLQGQKRVKSWIKKFKKTPIDVFYSTNTIRTQNTCKPIAKSKNKEVVLYDIRVNTLKEIVENNLGKTIFIVGHSNSIPSQINVFLKEEIYQQIDEDEFGNLYTIEIRDDKMSHKLENYNK